MNQLRPQNKLGKLPRKYTYVENPHKEHDINPCPRCNSITHNEKFVLFIIAPYYPPITLGHTCIFCSKCELIITHKKTLAEQVQIAYSKVNPNFRIEEFFTIGTFDKSVWKKNLNKAYKADNIYYYLSDFESYFVLGKNY
jgi:hypothetical protein